ncbi:MAG: metallophosphoesterase family protein [Atribacterota bacterium]
MKFLIIGDVHGYFGSMFEHLINVQDRGIEYDAVIQCGDFGFYDGVIKSLKQIINLTNFKKPIYFIDGNHENHDYLLNNFNSLKKYNVFYQKRSSITILEDDTKIGWIGGSFNVDRPQYINGNVSNFPNKKEIDLTIKNIKNSGGVDLIISHSCPMNIGIGIVGLPEFQISAREYISAVGYRPPGIMDIGDESLTNLWNNLNGFKPKNWVFAHFHKYHYAKIEKTNFFCVGTCDKIFTKEQRIYVFDTKTKEILT